MVRQRLPAATRTVEWLSISDSSPVVRSSAAHRRGPIEAGARQRNARRRYLQLADLAIAGRGAVALIPAIATFSLVGGLRVLAATLAGPAGAGCALTLILFHRHWNLLFALSFGRVESRQQLECRIGAANRDCTKQLFSMNESAI